MTEREDKKDWVDVSRAELFEDLVICKSLVRMSNVLNIQLAALKAYIKETQRQTREMRIEEGLDLIACGVCHSTAAVFCGVGTGELLGVSGKPKCSAPYQRAAPRLSEADRIADAEFMARWGHV